MRAASTSCSRTPRGTSARRRTGRPSPTTSGPSTPPSSTRTRARLPCSSGPSSRGRRPERATRVARGLLAARRGGTWRTSEETVWALRGLEDYRAAHVQNHPDADAFFYVNGVELIKFPLHERKEWQESAS